MSELDQAEVEDLRQPDQVIRRTQNGYIVTASVFDIDDGWQIKELVFEDLENEDEEDSGHALEDALSVIVEAVAGGDDMERVLSKLYRSDADVINAALDFAKSNADWFKMSPHEIVERVMKEV